MNYKKDLRTALENFTAEFKTNLRDFNRSPKAANSFYRGHVSGSSGQSYKVMVNFNSMLQAVDYFMHDRASSKSLFEVIIKHKLVPENYLHHKIATYEESKNILPSIIGRIGGGFIARNFELNSHQISITNESFELALNDLFEFYDGKHIQTEVKLALKGLEGDCERIDFGDGVSIEKCDQTTIEQFCLSFSTFSNFFYVEDAMEKGDYILKYKFQTSKDSYKYGAQTHIMYLHESIHKQFSLIPILGIPGYLHIGELFCQTKHWVIGGHGATRNSTKFNRHFTNQGIKKRLDDIDIKRLHSVHETIKSLDFAKLDERIKSAISRLEKAKKSFSLEDRVVELSMALEFITPTKGNNEVTLRRLITVNKILGNPNREEDINKHTGNFLTLRGAVIHGAHKIKNSEIETINYAEEIVQELIISMIQLSGKYTFTKLDKIIQRAIYSSYTLRELLELDQNK